MSACGPRVEIDHGTHKGRDWSLVAWAEALAAELPPLTPDEAAQVGVVAARLDARASAPSGPQKPETPGCVASGSAANPRPSEGGDAT